MNVPQTRPYHFLGAALVCLGVIAAFLTPVHFGGPEPPWKAAAHIISKPIHDSFLTLGILALLLLAWREKSRSLAIRVVAVMGGETALFGLIKAITWFGLHQLPRPSGGDGGFPSGHTAASCALAFLLTERFPRCAFLFYGIAALVGWSRVGDSAHYAYQVLAGAILGIAVAVSLTPRFTAKPPAEKLTASQPQ